METYLEKLLSQIRCKKARPYIAEEIRDHIECQIADNLSEGMTSEEAEKNAVLPADPALEVEILGTHPDRCVSCGAPIIKRGNRKKYCEKCAGIAYKRQQAEYARKKRTESKNRG